MAKRETFQKERTIVKAPDVVPNFGMDAWINTTVQLSGMANDFLDKKAVEQGAIEGSQAGNKIDAEGKPLFNTADGSTLRGSAFNKAASQTYRISMENTARSRFQEMFDESKFNPVELQGKFDSYAQGMVKDISANTPEFSGIAEAQLSSMSQSYMEKATSEARSKALEDATEALSASTSSSLEFTVADFVNAENVDSAINRAAQTRAVLERILLENVEQGAQDTSAFNKISPELAQEMGLGEINLDRTGIIDLDTANSMLDKFDQETSKAIALRGLDDAIRIGEGSEFLREFIDNEDTGLNPAEKKKVVSSMATHLSRIDKLNTDIGAESKRKADRKKAEEAARFVRRVDKGEATREENDEMLETEAITPSVWLANERKMDALAKQQTDRLSRHHLVSSSMMSGQPMDHKNKDHQKAVDEFLQGSIAGLDPLSDEAETVATNISAMTGIVPESVRIQIRTNAKSLDPQRAFAAADFASRLREEAPQAYSIVPKDEKAFSLMVSESVNAGMPVEEAVQISRQFVYETPEPEKEELKKVINDSDFRTASVDRLDDFIDEFWDTAFSFQPEAPAAMLGEYNSLVKNYFIRTRDQDLAHNLAFQDMRQIWGKTEINGEQQLMRTPPEMIHGANDWMEDQLTDLKASLAVENDMIVVSDNRTARVRPTDYALFTTDENGMEVPILDGNNRPARWVPDFSSTSEGISTTANINKSIAEATNHQAAVSAERSRRRGMRSPAEALFKKGEFDFKGKSADEILKGDRESDQEEILSKIAGD